MELNNKREYFIEDDYIYLKFYYNENILNSIRKINGRRWNPSKKFWYIPINFETSEQIKELLIHYNFFEKNSTDVFFEDKRLDFKLSDKILNFNKNYTEKFKELKLKFLPRNYQNSAIEYMVTQKRVINGDDVGLGKTLEALFASIIVDKYPILIVCPSSVKYHWKNFCEKIGWFKDIFVIDSGCKEFPKNFDILIINYDLLGKWEKYEKDFQIKKRPIFKFKELEKINWKILILDEMHFIKSNKALRTKLIKKLSKKIEYIWGLTGTPIMNKPSELIAPLSILNKFNSLFSNWKNFVIKYCNGKETNFGWDISGASNTLELNKILKSSCYFRREKRDVLKDLPKIQETILNVDIENRKKYDKAEGNFIEYIEENFSQMKIDSALMAQFLVLRNTLRQLSIAGKMKEIINWLDNYKESTNEKLIIFGIYREPLLILSDIYKSKVINGSVSSKEKQLLVEDFIKNNEQFLFGNIQSLGTGVDGLQFSCSNMLIIELPERPSDIEQVIGRLNRSGQKNSVNVYFMLSDHTIDGEMWENLEEKRIITTAVNKGKEIKSRNFNDMLIKKMLNKN